MRTPIESPEIASPSVQVEYHVRFTRGPRGRRRARNAGDGARDPGVTHEPLHTERLPKITRLLVLGHHFEQLIRDGVVKDYAEIARLTGLTRARVTQIVNLTLLAPEIQEKILNLTNVTGGSDPVTERALREVAAQVNWQRQKVPCLIPQD